MSKSHYFRVRYNFNLRGGRRIKVGKEGIYVTEDANLAGMLDKSMGATRMTEAEASSFAAFRAKGKRLGSNADTGPLPSPKPRAEKLPTLAEIKAAGYKDPQAILDQIKAEPDSNPGPPLNLAPPSDDPVCEGCGEAATTQDGEGIDLCETCATIDLDDGKESDTKKVEAVEGTVGVDGVFLSVDMASEEVAGSTTTPAPPPPPEPPAGPQITPADVEAMTKAELRDALNVLKVPAPPAAATSADLKAAAIEAIVRA